MKKILLLLFTSFYSFGQFPTTGLLAQYGFDNGSLVDGANGINFTQNGSSLTAVDDRFHTASNAISLNGDYLSRSDIDFTTAYEDLTYSFWVKSLTNDNDTKTIFFDYGGTFPVGYHIYLKNGKITFAHTSLLGSTYKTSTAQSNYISDGNWHNIVTILDQCVAKIYVDGQLQATGANNNAHLYLNRLVDSNGNLVVSNNRAYNLQVANQYTDVLDDILIYNRVLNTTEINDIITYNNYCFAPDSSLLTVNGETENSVDISLSSSAVGNYEFIYIEKGQPITSGQVASIAPGATITLSGLLQSTSYEVFIRKECSVSFDSDWSTAINFRTKGIIYVNINATGNNTGSNWVDAYVNLQDALSNTVVDGEIWVAQGTYIPHVSSRNTAFNILKSGLKIYGGFGGNETQLIQRDFQNNVTTLSGDLENNDDQSLTFVNTTRNDNSYNILTINANNTLIDGFTISGGHANGTVVENKLGAAIFKNYGISDLNIYNCIFEKNVAIEGAAAVFSRYSTNGNLKVHNCTFKNNVSRYGTSIYSYVDNNWIANVEVISSLFYSNEAKDNGTSLGYAASAGWFRAYGTSSTMNVTLVNNTYAKNSDTGTTSGLNNFNRATIGMGYTGGVLNAVVANNIFWGNTTSGGVVAKSIAQIHTTLGQNITVKNSTGQDNFSTIPSQNVSNVLNTDPLFLDFNNNDYSLLNGSSAIDSGDNVSVVGNTDLAGNMRIYNTTVDRGCYEFGSVLDHNSFINENEFLIYPNPVKEDLFIETEALIESVEIYSLDGKLILQTKDKIISTNSFEEGVYLLRIIDKAGVSMNKKFIKK